MHSASTQTISIFVPGGKLGGLFREREGGKVKADSVPCLAIWRSETQGGNERRIQVQVIGS